MHPLPYMQMALWCVVKFKSFYVFLHMSGVRYRRPNGWTNFNIMYIFFLIAIFLFRCPRCPVCRGEQHTTPSPPSPPTPLPRPSLPSRQGWVRSPLDQSQTVLSRGEEEGIIIMIRRQIPGNIKVFKFYRFYIVQCLSIHILQFSFQFHIYYPLFFQTFLPFHLFLSQT